MIREIVGFWKASRTFNNKVQAHPILGPALQYILSVLNNTAGGLGKYWSQDGKARLLTEILVDVERTIAGPDPVQSVRQELLDKIAATAKLEVLILSPDDPAAATWLLEYEGITGELKACIPELAGLDGSLRECIYASSVGTLSSFDDFWNVVLVQYWGCHLYMSAYNIARCTLGDYHRDPQKDWYMPCYVSLCIWQEQYYRGLLRMPSALFGPDSDLKALFHMATWRGRLLDGTREPRLAWESEWVKAFHQPSPHALAKPPKPEYYEIQCPICFSKRAVFREDGHQITCYSCNTSLNVTLEKGSGSVTVVQADKSGQG